MNFRNELGQSCSECAACVVSSYKAWPLLPSDCLKVLGHHFFKLFI